MSIHETLLDTEEIFCEMCGLIPRVYGRVCWDCKQDNADIYSDMKIQDKKEGV